MELQSSFMLRGAWQCSCWQPLQALPGVPLSLRGLSRSTQQGGAADLRTTRAQLKHSCRGSLWTPSLGLQGLRISSMRAAAGIVQ